MSASNFILRIRLPDGQTRDYPITAVGLTIGRGADNDVRLPDPKVSSHHARVSPGPTGATLVDVGSSNGTFINGQRMPAQVPHPIRPGDVVVMGETGISLYVSEQPAAPSGAAAAPSLAREVWDSGLILRVQVGGLVDELPVTQREVGLGRAPDNEVILESPTVSGRHCRLRFAAGQMEVMDAGSLNGTRLNGQPLPARVPTPFNPGDVIQIADFSFAVRYASAESPAPPPLTRQVRLAPTGPAGLIVYAAGQQRRYVLKTGSVTLGRANDNDIVIPAAAVSGRHARIEGSDGTFWITDLGSSNGLVFQGQRVPQKVLAHGDVLTIGPDVALEFRAQIGFTPVEAVAAAAPPPARTVQISTERVTIGRARDNSMVLDHPQVSRYHAVIERLGTRQRITDLKSANGVYVNGKRIEKTAWLKEGDEIRIGPYRLQVGENVLQHSAEEGLRVDVLRLQKWVSKKKNLLQDISLSLHPQEFVALVGLSGSGKSTLMDAINGFRPATHGAVLVNNVNLYQNFDLFRNDMGYVPQKDIVHAELTVYKALDYAARLRMPADTTPAERHQRIMEVLEDLDLTERRDLPIHKLSGGQLKRVSIGVELLTKPRLFFLDEPTSGLDPGTEYNMMRLLRKLADQGRTIVLITHATKNVMMCDKVIILVRGGHVAYFGPPEEALTYFDQFRTEQERRTKDIEFDDIYVILEDEKRGTPQQWAERYQRSPQYLENVINRLKHREEALPAAAKATGVTAAGLRRRAAPKRVSALRQFFILSMRNLAIMTQDRMGLALILFLAPFLSLISEMGGRKQFDPVEGSAGGIISTMFMGGLIAYMVGALSSVREIVKEIDIYKRERIVNLKIMPYVMSKVWIGLALALYNAFWFLVVRQGVMAGIWPTADLGHGPWGFGHWIAMYITLFLISLSGYLMGLLISALAPNQNVAILLVIVALVPQFLFAGGMMPLDVMGSGGVFVSYGVSNRWAFEAAVNLTGIGKPLVDDPCWDDRDKTGKDGEMGWNDYLLLSDGEKTANGCVCMGSNIFTGPCSTFPGIRNEDYFTEGSQIALVQPEPVQPQQPTAWPTYTPWPTLTPYPSPTPYPTLTPLPTPADPRKMQEYMDDMQAQGDVYQEMRERQGDEYSELRERQGDEYQQLRERQGEEYQDVRERQGDEYQAAMEEYADLRSEWQRDREMAIGGAEGLLKAIFEGHGHTFKGNHITRWIYMTVILAATLIITMVLQKRKDTV